MKRDQIFLSKNFTVIESDIPFTLKFNIKDNTANSAEDVINFKSGWYIFDNNKLLPQYVDGVYNLPKYNCWIEYDETLSATPPHWYTCYINPKSVESLSSEVTELDPAQLARLRQDIQTNGGKIDGLELLVNGFKSANSADLGAVKTSVDAVKTSVDAVKTSVDALSVDNVDGFNALLGELTRLSSDIVAPFKSANHSDLEAIKNAFSVSSSLYFEGVYDLASAIRASDSWEGHYYCDSYFVLQVINYDNVARFNTSFNASSLCKVDCFLSTSVEGSTATSTFYIRVNGDEVYRDVKKTSVVSSSALIFKVIRCYCAGSPVPHN